MCGIAGIVNWREVIDAARVRRMTDAISYRGPDDAGVESCLGGQVVLGHRRLSIIDLSPLGHQPMRSASGRSWIVYNGEIYNYREIKRDLEALGASFRSGSDTEVILEAYERWGLPAVERFRGMFAFALWDESRRQLHLVRDRFGVKPLFYASAGQELGFASEMRALSAGGFAHRDIDPQAAAEFLQFGYTCGATTILTGVSQVKPGCALTFQTGSAPVEWQYWSTEQVFASSANSELRRELAAMEEVALLDRLEDALATAFDYRMVADVPVGLFLSGGIDSSTVATVLARRSGVKLRTFTIGYGDSEFDETPYAREVARLLDADHTEVTLSERVALDVVERLPQIADEPIGDSSLIPTFLVSQVARQHVTVALSADGADEFFGGYARYPICGRFARRQGTLAGALYSLGAGVLERAPSGMIAAAYAASRAGKEKFAGINDKVRKFVRMSRAASSEAAYEAAVSEWTDAESRSLLARPPPPSQRPARLAGVAALAAEERFMYFDSARYLPGDLLTKVDRASMAVSLEAREPFLDQELAKLAIALPLEWKIRGDKNKYALRRILARHLPAALFERPKKGFSVPIAAWLRGPLRSMLLDELAGERVRRLGILDPQTTQAALDDFLAGGRRTSPAGIWFLFQLHLWAGRWLQ